MVRKPDSQRGPQLDRSANATEPGIRIRGRPRRPGPGDALPRSVISPSPALESTRSGSRIAQIVASTKTRKA